MVNNNSTTIEERLSSIESALHSLARNKGEVQKASSQSGELLTIEQAAEFLSLSKATIYSKVSRNELPYMKPGKRLYFLREQLLEYIKAGHCETAKEMAENAHQYLTKSKGGQRNGQ